jgi:hypothetical protein
MYHDGLDYKAPSLALFVVVFTILTARDLATLILHTESHHSLFPFISI